MNTPESDPWDTPLTADDREEYEAAMNTTPTKTPRTDAERWIWRYPEYHQDAPQWVSKDFARQLETELAQWKESCHKADEIALEIMRERDEAREELAQLKPHPEPLPRPDGPGWWWEWRKSAKEWGLIQVLPTVTGRYDYGAPGLWLPATPPPPPVKEESK